MANSIFGTAVGNSAKSPLSRSPFFSRFSDFEQTGKNYILVGFHPGVALQAAELNELQDNYHKNLTLSNLMFSNWVPKVVTHIKNNSTNTVTDVLWDGAVPLDPALVTLSGTNITFAKGWYYYTHGSGLCFWVHSQQNHVVDASTWINNPSTTPQYIGLKIDSTDISSSVDNRLFDNSSGFINTASPGAYRIQHEILTFAASTNINENKSVLQILNGQITWLNTIPL
jgi:hypothetical protein